MVGGGIWEFVNDTDGPAFMERKLMGLGMDCLSLQLMKATLLAESSTLYFIFSPGFLCYNYVYRRESSRYRSLPSFLTFFIISPFQVFFLYKYLPVIMGSLIFRFQKD